MLHKINYCIISFTCILIWSNCKSIQTATVVTEENKTYWTKEKRDAFAMRNVDSTKWNMGMLENDLEFSKSKTWPSKPAISEIPSPVAKYRSPGGSLRNISLTIKDKHILGFSVGWAKGDFNEHLFKENQDLVRIYFNILILMDDPNPELSAGHIVSRNHPHYLASGSQKTKVGKVDWVQVALADDSNYAIISQRIFDLNYGRTILVAPQKDGSLRFLQMESVDSQKELEDYLHKQLEQEKGVVEFFSNNNVIE